MPCYDGSQATRYDYDRRDLCDDNEAKRNEAMLCGLMKLIERRPEILNDFDEVEQGVSIGELLTWWERHKRKDDLRRK